MNDDEPLSEKLTAALEGVGEPFAAQLAAMGEPFLEALHRLVAAAEEQVARLKDEDA